MNSAAIPSPTTSVWHILGLPVRAYALCIVAGIIVGSALIRCVLEAPDRATGLSRLRALSAELAEGVRNPVK